MVNDQITQIFLDFVESPLILSNLLQEFFILIYEIAQKNISTKNVSILNLLKIKESSKNIQKFMLNIY